MGLKNTVELRLKLKGRDVRPQQQREAVVCLPAGWINLAVSVTFESDLGV